MLCAALACVCLRPVPAFGEQISRSEAAAFFPGYTLRTYGSYSPQSEVYADYSRIEDGVLHVRRALFPPDLSLIHIFPLIGVYYPRPRYNMLQLNRRWRRIPGEQKECPPS